jgi:tyrocidine synthetase III
MELKKQQGTKKSHNELYKLRVASQQVTEERDYWRAKMAGDPVKSTFPYDIKNSYSIEKNMDTVEFKIEGEQAKRLINLSNNYNYTLNMIMVAGLKILLSKYTSNEDIIVGAPMYRQKNEGNFLNTVLPLRVQLSSGISFKELLIQVKNTIVEADRYKNYPMELLLEYLNKPCSGNDFPLFDIAILLENIQEKKYLAGIPLDMIFSFKRVDGSLDGKLEFNRSLYRKATIENIITYYKLLLQKSLKDINREIASISILPEEEKKKLLQEFNDSRNGYPQDKTIDELFETQAEEKPDQIAMVYNGRHLSYAELSQRARVLSVVLQNRGVRQNDIVGIICPNSLEMLIGILAIMEAGGAYLPIAQEYPDERRDYIVKDSGMKCMLTNTDLSLPTGVTLVTLSNWAFTGEKATIKCITKNSGNVAYVMYTSGSTGKPKGVLVEHHCVIRLVKEPNYICFHEKDRILQTGALEFDASTFEIWGALLNGLTLFQVPKNILLDSNTLKKAITKYQISIMWMTAPLFDQMVESDSDIFTGIRELLVGGDVLTPSRINKVRQRHPSINVTNGYGPTENTTFSTTYSIHREFDRQQEEIPIGTAISNSTAYIVDCNLHLCPGGVPGELVVGGDGVARGYLNNPELTKEKFIPDPWLEGKQMYKTGDRARRLEDGNIEFLGRIDHQVKIRGYRVELGEIETRIQEQDKIIDTVVLVKTGKNGEKNLCAYIVLQDTMGEPETFDVSQLKKSVEAELPVYMVPSYFVVLKRIPLNRNGKVDRSALPEPEITNEALYTSPRDEIDTKMTEIFADVLGVEKNTVGIDSNFWEMGGHSLKAARLIANIHEAFHFKMQLSEIFKTSTVREIADIIKDTSKLNNRQTYQKIRPAPKKSYYRLSSAQKRIYVLHQMNAAGNGISYNIPYVVRLEGDIGNIEKEKIKDTIHRLIRRHESLRTSFIIKDSEPVQVIHKDVDFDIDYYKVKNSAHQVSRLIRAFDLSKAPLLRVGLIKESQQSHILVLDMHHIITDGTSQELFFKEFLSIYAGKEEQLPELKIHYKDFAEWQDSKEQKNVLRSQENYWLKQFNDEIPVLNLPIDKPRPSVQQFEGRDTYFSLDEKETASLKLLAAHEGTTLFTVLLTLYTTLLTKITGQQDIIVGTPVAGRKHNQLQSIIGMFVNTLAIRNKPRGDTPFIIYLRDVKTQVLGALENQDYPFEELVEKVDVNRNAARNPLFDVMLTLQNMDRTTVGIDELYIKPYEYRGNIAKFDLSLFAVEVDERMELSFQYAISIFKQETIQRFKEYFCRLVAEVQANPKKRLLDIEIIPESEKQQILYDFNHTEKEYSRKKTIHRLFEDRAATIPDAPALLSTEPSTSAFTYREFNAAVDSAVLLLQARGVTPGNIIALKLHRSLEMVIQIMAILKVGCAYLPIIPDTPQERIDYMMKDSGAQLLLTEHEIKCLRKFETERPLSVPTTDTHSPNSMSYIIYTSGSTGKPKGVMVEHASVVNLLNSMQEAYPIDQTGTYLFKTEYIFDVSVTELFGWFMGGGRLAVLEAGGEKDPQQITAAIQHHSITHINFVPSMFSAFLEQNEIEPENTGKLKHLKYIFLAGETLPGPLVKRFTTQQFPSVRLENIYGPTEATVYTTKYSLLQWDGQGSVPIGKPLNNSTLYILNQAGNIQPLGIPGELYIGGASLARGYMNNPQLTAEKFAYITLENRQLRLYKTGDLARWLPDGNIEFLGRIDYQVKIRGYRIELEEIESRLLQHTNVKKSAVAVLEDNTGDKFLCAYITVNDEAAPPTEIELKEYLAQTLPGYMLPSYILQLEDLPLTTSGKVNRKVLPTPQEVNEPRQLTPPQNEMEKSLAKLWADVLGIKLELIGRESNFFQLGGHSLKAVSLIARISKELNLPLTLGKIFASPTLHQQSTSLQRITEETYKAIQKAEPKANYRLSPAQKRQYILQNMVPDSIAYNLPMATILEGKLDREKLEYAFRQLIARHESLRTSFAMIGDETVQRIHKDVAFEIEYFDLTANTTLGGDDAASIIQRFPRSFVLSEAPLMRVGLIKEENNRHTLMVDQHHIITDGTSHEIFLQELTAFYAGRGDRLPPLEIQYKDYSEWQNNIQQKAELQNQQQYWLKQFKDELPVLKLPLDNPRPSIQQSRGQVLNFSLKEKETMALKELAAREGTTMFAVLMTLYTTLLARITGQQDIVVGSPVAGRRHNQLQHIIGMFVNTLAIRNKPEGDTPFITYLRHVKAQVLGALENQDYPFEELVEKVAVNRDATRNPLFDVMFTLQNMERSAVKIADLNIIPYDYLRNISKFDLSLFAIEVGDRLRLTFQYATSLFRQDSIRRLKEYFLNLVTAVSENPTQRIRDFDILPEQEKHRLLVKFNDTAADYAEDKTLHECFREKVIRTPHNIALVGKSLTEDHTDNITLSYLELEKRTDYLAARLMINGIEPGDIVGIDVARSLEMIYAMLAIVKTGAAYLPISKDFPEDRKQFMLADSCARLLVSDKKLNSQNEAKSELNNTINNTPQLNIIDEAIVRETAKVTVPLPTLPISTADPVYVIYTSGSTGRPKGVVVEHRNVVNVVSWFARKYCLSTPSHVLQMSEITFDPSVNQVFGTILYGSVLFTVDKDLLFNIEALRRYIDRHQIHLLNFVPQMLDNLLCGEGASRLDSVKNVLSGGEKLDETIKNNILRKGYKLYNQYGPTEATIDACVAECTETDPKVTLGTPISNIRCYILDKYDNLVPVGVTGELYLAGAGLARGYLNNPQLTADKFVTIAIENQQLTLYKTGDLVRWQPDGCIEFQGRKDNQVKIRGYRIEPGEVETRIQAYETVKEAVVEPKEKADGEKYLCAYVVLENHDDRDKENIEKSAITDLKYYLSNRLPEYMLPAAYVILEQLPLTPNGKINRRALPLPRFTGNDSYAPPSNRLQKELIRLWAEQLGLREEKIGIDDNFFQLGGHSLKATILAAKVHRELNIKLPLAEFFKTPTVRGLSNTIEKFEEFEYNAIQPVEKKDYYPLSSAQKRLYFLSQMKTGTTNYNMPKIVELHGKLEKEKFREAFEKLISRHESLRTGFQLADGQPVQRVWDSVEFEIEYSSLSGDTVKQVQKKIRSFIRPFELSIPPLMRVGLIEEETKNTLLVDMHHIVSDGVSMSLLVKDFMKFYSGKLQPDLELQYKDFTEWRNATRQMLSAKEQETFWLKEFEGELPVLELPVDYPRPAFRGIKGATINFDLIPEFTSGIDRVARQNGVTMYILLLSIYNVFLAKLSGQEDIVIGSPEAGRRHADLENIIGMFVNTLAIRNFPAGDKTFTGFLSEVKEKVLAVFENQDYQYEELVEKVVSNRDTSRNPLFDSMFVMQNTDTQKLDIPGLKLMPYPYKNETSKFDLTLRGVERKDKLFFSLEYSTQLFKESTIKRFVRYFKYLLSVVLNPANKNIEISEIEIISEEDKRRMLLDFNDTAADYPREKTLHRLFEEQVYKTPDSVAVVGDVQLSYRELKNKSSCLSRALIQKGTGTGTIVGIMVERSINMIVGILGILGAGAAYLPIDLDYPKERINFMLADSSAQSIITSSRENSVESLSEWSGERYLIEELMNTPCPLNDSTSNAIPNTDSSSLAYIIYTSGSTGRPKGVMVEQFQVVNLVMSQQKQFGLDEKDRVLQFSSICFDASVEQIFMPLLCGAVLVLVDKNTLLDNTNFEGMIATQSITHFHAVPSFLSHISLKARYGLKRVLSGGDSCPPSLAAKWSAHCDFYNRYGPTETTVTSIEFSVANVDKSQPRLPIGKPIANTRVFLFDKWMKPVPVGVVGELYIGGDGVTRGYLNRPELTARQFVSYASASIPTIRLYKTGDLARWIPDGNIEFMGRIDHQVKIRGYRIELGEIENWLKTHEHIQETVVIAIETADTEKQLCAYIVPTQGKDAPLDKSALKNYLSAILPDYMVPKYYVPLDSIPLTPSGKLDRKTLPGISFETGNGYAHPRDQVEAKLLKIWHRILFNKENDLIWEPDDTPKFGIEDDFFELGGHSLKTITMASLIHKELGQRVPVSTIFEAPTIKALADFIRQQGTVPENEQYIAIEPVEKKQYYPVSPAQNRLFIQQQIQPESTAYNLPTLIGLEEQADTGKLEKVLKELTLRHESFRTSFMMIDGKAYQIVHDEPTVALESFNIEAGNDIEAKKGLQKMIQGFIRPFDLSRPPLIRAGMCSINGKPRLLMIDIHHIIFDGYSLSLLQRDFMEFYRDKPLPLLRHQYKDYSEWQHSEPMIKRIRQQEKFWLKEFEGTVPQLNLPTDFPRQENKNFEGNRVRFELDEHETAELKKVIKEEKTTVYISLLTVFVTLLSRLSGQDDIVVGTDNAGRNREEFKDVIGNFVNTMAIRFFPTTDKTFWQLMTEAKSKTAKAFDNQEYPFEELASKLSIKREPNRNPIFDVMFGIMEVDMDTGFDIKPGQIEWNETLFNTQNHFTYENKTAKFDMVFMGTEVGGKLYFSFEYSTKLFREDTIKKYIGYFKEIVKAVTGNIHIKIIDIPFSHQLKKAERKIEPVDFGF